MRELITAYKDLDIIDKKRELAEEFIEFLGIIKKLRDDMEIDEPINLSFSVASQSSNLRIRIII